MNGTEINSLNDSYAAGISMAPLLNIVIGVSAGLGGLGVLACAAYALRHRVLKCCNNMFNTASAIRDNDSKSVPLLPQGKEAETIVETP
jgi:hypothetical protein